jgi:GxxExxY protein
MLETEQLNALSNQVIAAALAVHSQLGPGLLESTYEACLAYELAERDLTVEQQQVVPLVYKGLRLEQGYRLDLLVEHELIIEIKAVDELLSIHKAQLLTYLKLTGLRLGLLMNFNVQLLKTGIQRVAHHL